MDIKINKIIFTLENCERVTIDWKYVGYFSIEGITEQINRVAINSIKKYRNCSSFCISLCRYANNYTVDMFGAVDDLNKSLDRINKWNDITSIEIIYSDNSKEEIYPIWLSEDKDEIENVYQKSIFNKYGDLFLKISKDKNIYDIWDKNEIEKDNLSLFYISK